MIEDMQPKSLQMQLVMVWPVFAIPLIAAAEGRVEVVHKGVNAILDAAEVPDVNMGTHAARALANMTERGTKIHSASDTEL